MKSLRALGAGAFLALSALAPAFGANVPLVTGVQEPSQIAAIINGLIQSINSNVQLPVGSPRNFLDNGAFAVQQYGTGVITCATTGALGATTYVDRWGCDANVSSGAGREQIITATPSPPAGFPASLKVYRNSGILTQPVCTLQEIASLEATYLAGQTVTFSFYGQALANLAADNSSVVNAYVLYGTGTDQGLGSWTTSPAITPAWTGINSSLTQAFTLTTAWARYQFTANVPTTATEVAVAICFTPTAAAVAGTTDGFAFTGAQLEIAQSATAYEFRKFGDELARAQRYFNRVSESATAATTRGSCVNLTSSISNCVVTFPQVMRVVPTMSYTTGFGIAVAAQTSYTACTANATSTTATSVASPYAVLMSCATSAAGGALGTSTSWGDSGGSGVINAWADF